MSSHFDFGWGDIKSLFYKLQKMSSHQMSNLWQCFQLAKRVWRDVVGNLLKPPPAPNFYSPSSLITGHLTLATTTHTFLLLDLSFFLHFVREFPAKCAKANLQLLVKCEAFYSLTGLRQTWAQTSSKKEWSKPKSATNMTKAASTSWAGCDA